MSCGGSKHENANAAVISESVKEANGHLPTGGGFEPSPEDAFVEPPWEPLNDVVYKSERSAVIAQNKTPREYDETGRILERDVYFDKESDGYRIRQRPLVIATEYLSGLTADGMHRWMDAYHAGLMSPEQERDLLERLDKARMIDFMSVPGGEDYRARLDELRASDPPPPPPPPNPARIDLPPEDVYVPDEWTSLDGKTYKSPRAADMAFNRYCKANPGSGLEHRNVRDPETGAYRIEARPRPYMWSELTGLTPEAFERRMRGLNEGTLTPAEEYDILDRFTSGGRLLFNLTEEQQAKYEAYKENPPAK